MTLYQSMQDLVGETPLVRINNMDLPEGVNVYAKLELYNPSGSVKDRTGRYMVRDAEEKGILREGGTIVEGTAGNTGLGLAFAALEKGYRVIFVVPTKFSEEKQSLMKALGAEIINTPREKGMLGAVAKADELLKTIPGAVSLKQFDNMSNPRAHFETTGPEIYRDLNGKIDYAVLGAGSGGTYTGVVGYLKSRDPSIKGILADPIGSTMGGGEHSDYDIEGIGNDFIAKTMDMFLVDEVIKVSDKDAFDNCRLLAKREGIIAGESSGAVMSAVKVLAEKIGKGNIVTVFPDRGDRYFSKHLFD